MGTRSRATLSPHAVTWAVTCAGALAVALTACHAGPPRQDGKDATLGAAEPTGEASLDARRPQTPHTREDAEAAGERFAADWFTFALASVRVEIADLHATRDLDATLSTPGALFATNAGFFDPRDAPLGLSVSRGVRHSAFAARMSGGVLEISDGGAELLETETYDSARKPDFAVQCRPRLVVGGHANVKRDDGKRAERTAVCLRDAGRTLAFVLAKDAERGPSLHALGRYLEAKGCQDALSLDGGPSTGAAYWGARGLESIPLRGPIRQAIVVSQREGGAP